MNMATKSRLKVFEMACLRKILGVTCRDRTRNAEICSQLNLAKTINQRLQQRRLCYFGHIVRMKDARYPKRIHAWKKEAWSTKEALAGHGEGRLCGDGDEHSGINKMCPTPPPVEGRHRRATVACLKRHRQSNKLLWNDALFLFLLYNICVIL